MGRPFFFKRIIFGEQNNAKSRGMEFREKMRLRGKEKRRKDLEGIIGSYKELRSTVVSLRKKVSKKVVVPIGNNSFSGATKFGGDGNFCLGFMEGKLIHTNEIIVYLGANYFVKVSADYAVKIIDRRITKLSSSHEVISKETQEIYNKFGIGKIVRNGVGKPEVQKTKIEEKKGKNQKDKVVDKIESSDKKTVKRGKIESIEDQEIIEIIEKVDENGVLKEKMGEKIVLPKKELERFDTRKKTKGKDLGKNWERIYEEDQRKFKNMDLEDVFDVLEKEEIQEMKDKSVRKMLNPKKEQKKKVSGKKTATKKEISSFPKFVDPKSFAKAIARNEEVKKRKVVVVKPAKKIQKKDEKENKKLFEKKKKKAQSNFVMKDEVVYDESDDDCDNELRYQEPSFIENQIFK